MPKEFSKLYGNNIIFLMQCKYSGMVILKNNIKIVTINYKLYTEYLSLKNHFRCSFKTSIDKKTDKYKNMLLC